MIIISAYNPDWPIEFEQAAKHIRSVLDDSMLTIHHIGSTSVPGLAAKSVIDMLMEVKDLERLDQQNLAMEKLGYEVMGEYGIAGRRYFRKGHPLRTHHLHAFASGDSNILRHIAFRDYLVAHSEIARAYADLKRDVAKHCNGDMGEYCEGKEAFIKHYEAVAINWYSKLNK